MSVFSEVLRTSLKAHTLHVVRQWMFLATIYCVLLEFSGTIFLLICCRSMCSMSVFSEIHNIMNLSESAYDACGATINISFLNLLRIAWILRHNFPIDLLSFHMWRVRFRWSLMNLTESAYDACGATIDISFYILSRIYSYLLSFAYEFFVCVLC